MIPKRRKKVTQTEVVRISFHGVNEMLIDLVNVGLKVEQNYNLLKGVRFIRIRSCKGLCFPDFTPGHSSLSKLCRYQEIMELNGTPPDTVL